MVKMIFSGGTCADPWTNGNKCMQTSDGQPLSSWDQSQCGCNEEYMKMYYDGTWVTMNEGVSCSSGDAGGSSPAPATAKVSLAADPSGKMPVLLALLSLLTWTRNT